MAKRDAVLKKPKDTVPIAVKREVSRITKESLTEWLWFTALQEKCSNEKEEGVNDAKPSSL